MRIIKEIKECLELKRMLKNNPCTERQKKLINELKEQGIDVKTENPYDGRYL